MKVHLANLSAVLAAQRQAAHANPPRKQSATPAVKTTLQSTGSAPAKK
ncbi:hypothetical protein K3G63_14120 [Hymenobacter sp. HSC-4F20]|nr:hypothetical protein [Hymenobacter sp. HSC-4F20]MBX0291582.1 hypothetical protein [Hymenobacter sp. HSC-4F20]